MDVATVEKVADENQKESQELVLNKNLTRFKKRFMKRQWEDPDPNKNENGESDEKKLCERPVERIKRKKMALVLGYCDINEINKRLPDCIKVFGIKRVTNKFNSKSKCNARTYSYTVPTYVFEPSLITDEERKQYRITEDKKEQVKKGQSFMLHQIRKMVGLAIAVLRGHTDNSILEKAFGKEKVMIPTAPGLGLVLDTGEVENNSIALWLEKLSNHSYEPSEDVPEKIDEKELAAGDDDDDFDDVAEDEGDDEKSESKNGNSSLITAEKSHTDSGNTEKREIP
ncbi:hypothetical protein HF086_011160 [Spodoptera exigua]|uniref:tRNA pseudouridine synthase n=1 Tax=Spodoptera exigua TaxID=7107 RepID=A0A922MTK4_SPOEX|nr:hypothetical protein HF086_011160 [Spodoptera exigua]